MRIAAPLWLFILPGICGLLISGAGAGAADPATAQEKIIRFTSHIAVHADASMTVTETIMVRSAGEQIRRGIMRAFPTTYKDRFGNTVKVDFAVQAVLRDGKEEPYHLEHAANGEKIYIGQKDVLLPPGVYTYTIKSLSVNNTNFTPADYGCCQMNQGDVAGMGFLITNQELAKPIKP